MPSPTSRPRCLAASRRSGWRASGWATSPPGRHPWVRSGRRWPMRWWPASTRRWCVGRCPRPGPGPRRRRSWLPAWRRSTPPCTDCSATSSTRDDVAAAALAARRAAEGADCRAGVGRRPPGARLADRTSPGAVAGGDRAAGAPGRRAPGRALGEEVERLASARCWPPPPAPAPPELLRASRRWSEEDWAAAADGLRSRGWLDGRRRADRCRAGGPGPDRGRPPTGWRRRPTVRLEAGELAHLLPPRPGRWPPPSSPPVGCPSPTRSACPAPGG